MNSETCQWLTSPAYIPTKSMGNVLYGYPFESDAQSGQVRESPQMQFDTFEAMKDSLDSSI